MFSVSKRTGKTLQLCIKAAILIFRNMLTLNKQKDAYETLLFTQLGRDFIINRSSTDLYRPLPTSTDLCRPLPTSTEQRDFVSARTWLLSRLFTRVFVFLRQCNHFQNLYLSPTFLFTVHITIEFKCCVLALDRFWLCIFLR